jgi:CBS domain-containing protein
MDAGGGCRYPSAMPGYQRLPVVQAAQAILDHGGWCVYEVCLDVPGQRWEARALIFDLLADAVADAVEAEIMLEPDRDARLTGCDRSTLVPVAGLGSYLCYVSDARAPTPGPRSTATPGPRSTATPSPRSTATPGPRPTATFGTRPDRRPTMLVRDGMNPIVVTAGPDHTLREAARRMTARGVGAAVVIDDSLGGPCIITERDILHSNGVGQDIDVELVRRHLTSEVVYAAADWSLEQAAASMVRGGFRHVIVLDGSDVAGILSMRDIVRCWTTEGASCEIHAPIPGVV